jgi:hypothetical protein
MLNKIAKQQKQELLTLMLKNKIAEMWLTKKIAETPEEIKTLDIDKVEGIIKLKQDAKVDEGLTELKEQQEQYDTYISYLGKLEKILKAHEDNVFDYNIIDEAVRKVKEYV